MWAYLGVVLQTLRYFVLCKLSYSYTLNRGLLT